MSLEKSTITIEACDRMHNYALDCKIIKEEEAEDAQDGPDSNKPDIHLMPGSPLGCKYPPAVEDFNSLTSISLTR